MSRRSEQRREAVFTVYQHDLTGRPLHELFDQRAALFTRSLAHATTDHQDELDDLIGRYAKGWTLERIAPLERSIMRVALLEMLYPEVVPGETPIPPEGAISEAVETAKKFCGSDAPKFVNGILAAVLRDRTAGEPPAAAG
ncbi:transcription antitermination factor NusB [Patulibacter defluvii]|uniref:transcription antitermination factor NusB n=1 Tax=Patulibacter defluvii TaxID=3095358 RepID=UPI0035C9045A